MHCAKLYDRRINFIISMRHDPQEGGIMANKRYYNDLRLLQKRANQAMKRLERMEIQSPAYKAVQGQLEILGRQQRGDIGRRFSESGMATWNEYQVQKSILEGFLEMKTRTQKGAKQWVEDIWQGAQQNEALQLKESGITKKDWFEFWHNMPSNHKDRILGSDVIVKMLRTYTYKNRNLKDDQKLSVAEIADAINQAKNVKEAYKALGITYKDVKNVTSLGVLK